MKRMLLGAAAAAAMMMPGIASADMSGSITLGYENNDYDNSDMDAFNLGGDFVYGMSNGWNLQLDGRSTSQDWDCCSGNYNQNYVATHFSTDLGNFDVGGFAGLVGYYDDSGIMLGVEGRTGFGNFALDGSLGHTDFGDNGFDGTAYRVGGAFFFMPNLALTGGASMTNINSGNDYEVTELMIGGAYQFANNIELFAGYTNGDYQPEFGTDYENDTLEIGVRFNLNRGTLQANAADGAWSSAEHISDTWSRW